MWRGGYNSGLPGSVNQPYLNTECGINRVAIRALSVPGKSSLTATRPGLRAATVQIDAKPVEITGGLSSEMPQRGKWR